MTDTTTTEAAPPPEIQQLIGLAKALRPSIDCEWCHGTGKDLLSTLRDGQDLACEPCVGAGKVKGHYPLVITGVSFPTPNGLLQAPLSFNDSKLGDFVAVRPCDKDLDGQTFLGVYLGDFATGVRLDVRGDGVLNIGWGRGNPAIYVPELKRIIRGYESWWGSIESPDDLKTISDQDIDNTWYVQALRSISTIPPEKSVAPAATVTPRLTPQEAKLLQAARNWLQWMNAEGREEPTYRCEGDLAQAVVELEQSEAGPNPEKGTSC